LSPEPVAAPQKGATATDLGNIFCHFRVCSKVAGENGLFAKQLLPTNLLLSFTLK